MVVRKSIKDAGKEWNQITMESYTKMLDCEKGEQQTLTRATDAHESSNAPSSRKESSICSINRRKEVLQSDRRLGGKSILKKEQNTLHRHEKSFKTRALSKRRMYKRVQTDKGTFTQHEQ